MMGIELIIAMAIIIAGFTLANIINTVFADWYKAHKRKKAWKKFTKTVEQIAKDVMKTPGMQAAAAEIMEMANGVKAKDRESETDAEAILKEYIRSNPKDIFNLAGQLRK